MERFELPTACSQSKCTTRLCYTPNLILMELAEGVEPPWSFLQGRCWTTEPSQQSKPTIYSSKQKYFLFICWCRRRESNPQGWITTRRILSPLRLPVSPHRHYKIFTTTRGWHESGDGDNPFFAPCEGQRTSHHSTIKNYF